MTRMVTGDDIAIVAAGTITKRGGCCCRATEKRRHHRLVSVNAHRKTTSGDGFEELFKTHRQVCREHSTAAGFGESCVSFAHRERYPGRVVPLGTPDLFWKNWDPTSTRECALDVLPITASVRRSSPQSNDHWPRFGQHYRLL